MSQQIKYAHIVPGTNSICKGCKNDKSYVGFLFQWQGERQYSLPGGETMSLMFNKDKQACLNCSKNRYREHIFQKMRMKEDKKDSEILCDHETTKGEAPPKKDLS